METIPGPLDAQNQPTWTVVDKPVAHKKIVKTDYPDCKFGKKGNSLCYAKFNDHLNGFVLYDPHTGRSLTQSYKYLEDLCELENFTLED